MRAAVAMVNELEEQTLAGLRRAHDEFAQNGFEGMAITMTQTIRLVRDLASIARQNPAADALAKLSNEVLASLPLMEPLARREFGNTNYAILIQRAEEARGLLGLDQP